MTQLKLSMKKPTDFLQNENARINGCHHALRSVQSVSLDAFLGVELWGHLETILYHAALKIPSLVTAIPEMEC